MPDSQWHQDMPDESGMPDEHVSRSLPTDADLVRRALDVFRGELEDQDQHIEDAVAAAVVYALTADRKERS